MITVTRLNHSRITVNALMIESIEATPDTLITLVSGNKFHVLEKVDEVVRLIQDYMRAIGPIQAMVKTGEGVDHHV